MPEFRLLPLDFVGDRGPERQPYGQVGTEAVDRVHQSTGVDRLQRQRGPLRELSGHQLADERRVDVGLVGVDLAGTHERPSERSDPSAVNPVSDRVVPRDGARLDHACGPDAAHRDAVRACVLVGPDARSH